MIWSTGRRPRETISIALGQQCGPKWPPMIRSSFTSPFKKAKKMDYWICQFEALNFPFLIILVPWYFNKKYFFFRLKIRFLVFLDYLGRIWWRFSIFHGFFFSFIFYFSSILQFQFACIFESIRFSSRISRILKVPKIIFFCQNILLFFPFFPCSFESLPSCSIIVKVAFPRKLCLEPIKRKVAHQLDSNRQLRPWGKRKSRQIDPTESTDPNLKKLFFATCRKYL